MKNKLKILVFNVCLALVLIVFYGMLNISSSEYAPLKALAITLLPMCLILFFWINFRLIFKQKKSNSEVTEDDELQYMLQKYINSGKGVFKQQINLTLEHISKAKRQKEIFDNLLIENFNTDSNLEAFLRIANDMEDSLTANINKILKRLAVFDFEGYVKFNSGVRYNISKEISDKKGQQFSDSISYINSICASNEEMLIEFDNLIIELSRMNESEMKNDLESIKDMVNAMQKLHI